jgi:hypothetical protein
VLAQLCALDCAWERADFVHTPRIRELSIDGPDGDAGQLAAGVYLSTGFGFSRVLVPCLGPAPQPAWCLTAPQAEYCRRDDGRDGIALEELFLRR